MLLMRNPQTTLCLQYYSIPTAVWLLFKYLKCIVCFLHVWVCYPADFKANSHSMSAYPKHIWQHFSFCLYDVCAALAEKKITFLEGLLNFVGQVRESTFVFNDGQRKSEQIDVFEK